MAGPGSTSARLIAPPPPAYLEMALAAPPAELPSHMNPDSMEVEGAEEWAFFRAYWPHGMPPPGGNIPSPPDSNRSTAVPDDISEREPKTARKEETKGGDGRGSGSQGSGNGGNGKGGRAGAGGVKRQQGNGQQGNGGGNGSNWNRGSGGSSFGARGSDWGNRGGWRGDGRSGQGDSSDRDLRDVYYVLQLMQRLLLRHEDSINLLKVESSFVMHMKLNVPSSVVSMLYAAANSWREVKLAEPTKLDRPMRAALLYCLFMELKTRLEAVAEKPEDLERMSKLGWITPGPPITWSFLTWDAASNKQIVDTSKVPLSQAEVMLHVQTVIRLCPRHHIVARFHPTRPMAEEMKGDSLVFLLQTGQHGEGAAEMRDSLTLLCHSAAMNLVALQLKEDRFARSKLANEIAKCLQQY